MASEEIRLVPPTHHHHHRLDSQLVFQDDAHLRFPRVGGDPGPKTRELSGFIDDRFFQPQASAPAAAEFRQIVYDDDQHNHRDSWNGNRRTSTTPSGDGSEGDEEEEEDDEEDDDDDDEGDVGSNRGVMMKEGNVLQSGNDNSNVRGTPSDRHQQERVNQYRNEVTIADPDGDLYYSQYLPGPEGSGSGQKDVVVENGCGFSGRKEGSYSSESGESLRVILSDPVTGSLMDDAMILLCGHSFGDGGMQHVIRMKACFTCSHPVSEDSASPNLSLRAAVQAFRREEELQVYRSSKRRRDRFEQDKGSYSDSMPMDHPRGRGVQFPFAVTDRVVIKGNKRTPQRFVGREAIVTTQCLNGWYVVKTLDNAESVKLQYRSLAKVSDNQSSKPSSISKMTSDWL